MTMGRNHGLQLTAGPVLEAAPVGTPGAEAGVDREPLYTPHREVLLGQDGSVMFRRNLRQADGTFANSPWPSASTTGKYLEAW